VRRVQFVREFEKCLFVLLLERRLATGSQRLQRLRVDTEVDRVLMVVVPLVAGSSPEPKRQ